jgi:predicted outer membrane repeat protein
VTADLATIDIIIMNCLLVIEVLLSVLLLIFTSRAQGGAAYCVKPSTSSDCDGHSCQQCETLSFYLTERSITNLNKQENVTLYFLNGTHSGNCSFINHSANPKLIKLTPQTQLVMIGENHNVNVRCLLLELNEISSVQLENLAMINSWLHILPKYFSKVFLSSITIQHSYIELCGVNNALAHVLVENTLIDSSRMKIDIHCLYLSGLRSIDENGAPDNPTNASTSITFNECEFHNGTIIYKTGSANFTVKDCKLINCQMFVYNSIVLFSGDTEFADSLQDSALTSISSTIIFSDNILFINNTATVGGAMAIYSSILKIVPGTNVSFINNSALDGGGAIFVDPGFIQGLILMKQTLYSECFYDVTEDYGNDGKACTLRFANNSAKSGGGDVYGASLSSDLCPESMHCQLEMSDTASISSEPTRVCLCDGDGVPQCKNYSFVFANLDVYPGEIFSVSAIVVGGDFGPTIGVVRANFLPVAGSSLPSMEEHMYHQLTNSSEHCTQFNYSLHSNYVHNDIIMYLSTLYTDVHNDRDQACIDTDYYCSHTTPVYFNITLLPCAPGFTLLGEPPGCDCYPELTDNSVECKIVDKTTYFSWTNHLWMKIDADGVIYNEFCPFNYCDNSNDLQLYPDSQCAFNRAGRLCGGCLENYSLAIGSSNCIHCPNNNNLALLIFFAAAGFLLVFFIIILNLTVTQGLINGIVFYANIVWIYQSIFFPQDVKENAVLVFLRIFIAWVNLDFGIEACFVDGLTAFWKTWLQFVFPLYIWAIAGLIIVATRRSTRLTNLLGSRAVPVLVTLILISYMKLLRIVASALEFSTIVYTNNVNRSTQVVWSVDGNLAYFGLPHVFLFLAGLATLLLLWLPYTLQLFLIQWLRKLDQLRFRKWINRFHPIYDAYFAPLKPKHHYWFGILLLARGVLLVILASTFGVPDTINLLLLLILSVALLVYVILVQPYLRAAVLALQTSFLVNLTLISGFVIFAYTQPNGATLLSAAVGISTGIAFLQFCAIIVYSIVAPRCSRLRKKSIVRSRGNSNVSQEPLPAVVSSHSVSFRDSILEESQELLADNPTY